MVEEDWGRGVREAAGAVVVAGGGGIENGKGDRSRVV